MARGPYSFQPLPEDERDHFEVVLAAEPAQVTYAPPQEPEEQAFIWTGEGGMVQQQASAMAYFEESSADLEATRQAEPGQATEQPQASHESAPAAEQDAGEINRDSIELSDAQIERASQLAAMIEAQERGQQQSLEYDYAQER